MSIAITGGSGFVGQALVAELAHRGHNLKLIARANIEAPIPHLSGCDTIIHLAAITDLTGVDEETLDIVNRQLPLRLADTAAAAGVKRFVFVSSIAAIAGNSGELRADMPHAPLTAYGRAKAGAETGLLEKSGIETIILRAPLVYGPNARGNIGKLRKLAASSLPLPLAGVHNQRTMVDRHNMVDALAFLAAAPSDRVAGKIFHVTDDRPLSLPDLIRKVSDTPVRLFWAPQNLVRLAATWRFGPETAEKLFGDSLVDGSSLREIGWTPPVRD